MIVPILNSSQTSVYTGFMIVPILNSGEAVFCFISMTHTSPKTSQWLGALLSQKINVILIFENLLLSCFIHLHISSTTKQNVCQFTYYLSQLPFHSLFSGQTNKIETTLFLKREESGTQARLIFCPVSFSVNIVTYVQHQFSTSTKQATAQTK